MEQRKHGDLDEEEASLLQISSKIADFLPSVPRFREICEACAADDLEAYPEDNSNLRPALTQRLCLADHVSTPGPRIDLQPAHDALNWLEEHFILPCYDVQGSLPDEAPWRPWSLYVHDHPATEIWIYFDGSFRPTDQQIGFAAVMFVHTSFGMAICWSVLRKSSCR